MPIYGAAQAVNIADTVNDDTDRAVLVEALKWFAIDRAMLVESITAHRAVIIAVADDGVGAEMCDRLDSAWPVR